MRWSDIQFTPTKKTLRQFAGLGVVFFGGAALWQAFGRGHIGLATSLGGLSLLFAVTGLAAPQSLRLIYVGWMILAFPIGWTVSLLMLTIIYYGLFTPIGLVFRLIGRDPLDRTKHPGATSYWAPKPAPDKLSRYFKQF
jgi:Saxitoxin biosynthesis operon protein SxtJ